MQNSNPIISAARSSPSVKDFLETAGSSRAPVSINGAFGALAPALIRLIAEAAAGGGEKRPLLIVTPTEREAAAVTANLRSLGAEAEIFPWWGTAPYRPLAPSSPVFALRARLLAALSSPDWAGAKTPQAVAVSQRAFLSPVPPPRYTRENLLTIKPEEDFDPQKIARALSSWGWARVSRVQLKGEFALRGEVLDVLPPGGLAFRVLFNFNKVEAIKTFDPEDQSGKNAAPSLTLFPLKETVWTDERIETLEKNLRSCDEFKNADIERITESLIEKKTAAGEELLFPPAFFLNAENAFCLADYFYGEDGACGKIIFMDKERLDGAKEPLEREAQNLFIAASRERPVPSPERVFFKWENLLQRYTNAVYFKNIQNLTEGIAHNEKDAANPPAFRLKTEPGRSFFGNINLLREEISAIAADGRRIVIGSDSDAQRDRIASILRLNPDDSENKNISIQTLPASGGFSLIDANFIYISEDEIFSGRRRRPQSLQQSRSAAIETFVELNPGDYIVHVNYGIGLFQGIDRIKALGNERDYIKLLYAGDEIIFVPIEQVNLVQRYIGSGAENVRLDSIGSKSWSARKEKASKAAEELAAKLIGIYAKRKASSGFAFPKDSEWQAVFEANFPYEETADQLRCIEEIKADMESPLPMDRLICGDVGYGKTEVALRACFKAVMGGKQAVFLAPTTILAGQHYENFVERFAAFPVKVAILSRFVDAKETRDTLKKLSNGEIDILVGTHRVIQKDVAFKNLGLMVIDEEQRFGVKDKERLKEMKHNIDCLSLSATPIPRTLHISLLKIRDMSILATPPRTRRPIETVIEEISEERIADAVRSEARRGGQVYYLHNRIETLDETCAKLRALLPEMIIETAHGQMNSMDLEDIMHRFIHGGFHVLVSTTIIENGIDIPNVNTIIIDRADMYGVSQLYQLRGRVGRGDRAAYAYLFYPKNKALPETAMKRLQTISDFTELGSGFKIAMKDMEIRGAGSILGREQSGNIYTVGFDMYMRMLDEAISRLQKDDYESETETLLELEYSGFIPDSYIPTAQEKMEIYKKIAAVKTQEELEYLNAEITDRFGPPVPEASGLLAIAEIRILCRALSIAHLKEKGGLFRARFSQTSKINVDALLKLIKEHPGAVRLDPEKPNEIILTSEGSGLHEKAFFIREKLSALLAA
ncbi:MAG: transcription-repair coupling factor [Spirochaetaceae bacterium]|nr:transcription-repair coupling factor [Spirochaetaceae bacterium]